MEGPLAVDDGGFDASPCLLKNGVVVKIGELDASAAQLDPGLEGGGFEHDAIAGFRYGKGDGRPPPRNRDQVLPTKKTGIVGGDDADGMRIANLKHEIATRRRYAQAIGRPYPDRREEKKGCDHCGAPLPIVYRIILLSRLAHPRRGPGQRLSLHPLVGPATPRSPPPKASGHPNGVPTVDDKEFRRGGLKSII